MFFTRRKRGKVDWMIMICQYRGTICHCTILSFFNRRFFGGRNQESIGQELAIEIEDSFTRPMLLEDTGIESELSDMPRVAGLMRTMTSDKRSLTTSSLGGMSLIFSLLLVLPLFLYTGYLFHRIDNSLGRFRRKRFGQSRGLWQKIKLMVPMGSLLYFSCITIAHSE